MALDGTKEVYNLDLLTSLKLNSSATASINSVVLRYWVRLTLQIVTERILIMYTFINFFFLISSFEHPSLRYLASNYFYLSEHKLSATLIISKQLLLSFLLLDMSEKLMTLAAIPLIFLFLK